MPAEPVNLDAVIADMRGRAEGWNSERYTMLSPEAAGVLVAEFDRLRAVEQYTKDAQPALVVHANDDVLWARILPRLERWFANQTRIQSGTAART